MNKTKKEKPKDFVFFLGKTSTTSNQKLPNIKEKNLSAAQFPSTTKNLNHKTSYSSQFSTESPIKRKKFGKFPKKNLYLGSSTDRPIRSEAGKAHNIIINIEEINVNPEECIDNPKEKTSKIQKTQKTEELFHRLLQAFSEVSFLGFTQSENLQMKGLNESSRAKKKIMEILYKAFDDEIKENSENKDMNTTQYNQQNLRYDCVEENKEQNDFDSGFDKNIVKEGNNFDAINDRENDKKIETNNKNVREICDDLQFDIIAEKPAKVNQKQNEPDHSNSLMKIKVKEEGAKYDINKQESPPKKYKPKNARPISPNKTNKILADFRGINYDENVDENITEQKLKDAYDTIRILKLDSNKNFHRFDVENKEKENLIKKNNHLQSENLDFANKIQSFEKRISKFNKELENKDKKIESLESNINEMQSLKLRINELKDHNTHLEQKNANLQILNAKIQSEFDAYKVKTHDKEAFFEVSLKKLTALAEKKSIYAKNTLSHINSNYTESSIENIIEENQKLKSQTNNMGYEIITRGNDIEKYKQTFEYCKKVIEEKNEEIIEVEYRLKCKMKELQIFNRRKTIREILKFIKEFKKSKGKIFDFYSCEKCKNYTFRQVIASFNGLLCRSSDFNDVCPYCNFQGKKLKIKIIKELIDKIEEKFLG
ncbi:hypothetical protein SteCoe_17525 [Stentor coeruleus]|uniref:Uncharacterized protein n=1 Tax=Stentor coeruleus TaxID=5963 RepID=A0A1R2BYT5_9CILI|nr:hypothetical protein SteCoe_17525 [Stentor coeruleus]